MTTRSLIDAPADERRIDPDDWPAAITDTDGPQLIVAGPGTGKTEFLVRRAAHLINHCLDRADQVLVLTFSRRAAADLRQRIAARAEGSINRIAASTFHSFASDMLELFAPSAETSLLTGPEQMSLVAELLKQEDPVTWPSTLRGLLHSTALAADVTDFLLRAAERLIGPPELEEMSMHRRDWRPLPAFYRRYLDVLDRERRLDYGTLLMRAVALLERPENQQAIAAIHRYLLVDEYQETSPAQVELCRLITQCSRNITVAGDPYQSVYSFRGAELNNIGEFCDRFRDGNGSRARRIILSTSFRVPQAILEGALRITSPGNLPGTAGTVTPAPHSGVVNARLFDQASAEADWIATEVEAIHLTDRVRYSDMAVLLRSKRHLLSELSRALDRRRIPHNKPDARLVDHPAVALFLDLARAATLMDGREDNDEVDTIMRRLILGPLVEASISSERALLRRRKKTGEGWSEILRESFPGVGSEIADLLDDASWATTLPAFEGFWMAWSGLSAVERLAMTPESRVDRLALSSFAQALGRQLERDPKVSLTQYWEMTNADDFEATPLLSYTPSTDDRLTLTTLHQAKGLEFEVVFIAEASEGLFPDPRRGTSLLASHALSPSKGSSVSDLREFRLQEEMRLAYTAMTRARRRVIWTATSPGLGELDQRPSRFMMAAAGIKQLDDLISGPNGSHPPLTPREAQSHLRRLLTEPSAPAARRLAAATVLADPPGGLWHAATFAGVRQRGPDTGVIDESFRLSPSQAEKYASCPRSYVLERRLGVGNTTSSAAMLGNLVHSAIELAETAAMDRGFPRSNAREALDCLDRVWSEKANFGTPAIDAVWKNKAIEAIENLYARWPADSDRAIALEHHLEVEIGGRRWVGRADRIESTVDGQIRIVDYKTGTRPQTIPEAAQSLQLGFYLLASASDPLIAEHGKIAQAEMWFLRFRGNGWRRAFNPLNLAAVEEKLTEISESIAAESWAPRAGPHCDWCDLRIVCPLWPEGKMAPST